MKEQKFAIFLFGDSNYLFAIANTIYQLKKFDIINKFIVYLDMQSTNGGEDLLNKIDQRVEVFTDGRTLLANFINPINFEKPIFKRYSISILFRLFAVNFLDRYENIVILDSDNFYRKSFIDIQKEFLKGDIAFRSYRNIILNIGQNKIEIPYPSGAIIILNKTIYKYKDKFLDIATNYIKNNINCEHIDEVAFAYASYLLNLKVNLLGSKYNSFITTDDSLTSAVVCAYGDYKFWTKPIFYLIYQSWYKFNDLWNKLCEKENQKQFIKKINFKQDTSKIFEFYEGPKRYLEYEKNIVYIEVFKYIKSRLINYTDFISLDILGQKYWYIYHRRLGKNIHYELYIQDRKIYFCLHAETDKQNINKKIIYSIYELCNSGYFLLPSKPSISNHNFKYGIEFSIIFNEEVYFLNLYSLIFKNFIKNTIFKTLEISNLKYDNLQFQYIK